MHQGKIHRQNTITIITMHVETIMQHIPFNAFTTNNATNTFQCMYNQLSSETSFNQLRLPSVIQNIFIIYFDQYRLYSD